MSDPIDTICDLANCSREDAERVYSETKNVVEAVDRLLVKPVYAADKYTKLKRQQTFTEEQKILAETREILKRFDEERSTFQGQRVDEGSSVIQLHPEEMALQNNCSQQCQLPSLGEGAQTQETVCLSQSECSCDLQLNDQT